MFYDKYYPFHMAYTSQLFLDGERKQEEEFERMKSYYPEMAQKIQEKVENHCQLLDYEGSRLYDQYPDRFMMRRLCRQIRDEVMPQTQMQDIAPGFLDDLIEVIFYQEVSRRRCRRHRCRKYF